MRFVCLMDRGHGLPGLQAGERRESEWVGSVIHIQIAVIENRNMAHSFGKQEKCINMDGIRHTKCHNIPSHSRMNILTLLILKRRNTSHRDHNRRLMGIFIQNISFVFRIQSIWVEFLFVDKHRYYDVCNKYIYFLDFISSLESLIVAFVCNNWIVKCFLSKTKRM